jgi:hypothetical protein
VASPSTFQYGIYGAYGAWGNCVDGCTARIQCLGQTCKVTKAIGELRNSSSSLSNSRATCNSRLRIHNEPDRV